MNKISVSKFIEEYKNSSDKDACIERHIVTDYIPYEKKIAICNNIVNISSYKTVVINDEEKKIFNVDSRSRYVLFTLEAIRNYTDIDIEFSNGKMIEGFNLLNKESLIDAILSAVSERDYSELSTVLNMTIDDLFTNERSITSYIDNKLNALSVLKNSSLNVIDKILGNEAVLSAVINKLDKITPKE